MHLIVPFAAPLSDDGRAALRTVPLPNLAWLLGQLALQSEDGGDEWSLSPPHERALARALGLTGADGGIPWAARQARADGVVVGDLAWGLLTPVHWHLGTEQVSLVDPARLLLDEATSQALMDAVRELFTSEGHLLAWGGPQRWYLAHESLAGLPTASLDRVVGRNVDAWLGSNPAARRVRRLQAEVQMLLHAHPLNAEREARGLLPVNSFWLSGCGVAQPERPTPGLVLDERLRPPALAEDRAAWVKAWESLDATAVLACAEALRQGEPVTLTLCGERGSRTWVGQGVHLWRQLRSRWWPAHVADQLENL